MISRLLRVLSTLLILVVLLAACGTAPTQQEAAAPAPASESDASDAPARGDTAPPPAPTANRPAAPPAGNVSDGDTAGGESGAAEPEAPMEMAAEEAEYMDTAPEPPIAPDDDALPPDVREGREQAEVNPFVLTSDDNQSTFAMDVDTASYASARNAINQGVLPYPGEVRVEEFVNYFDYTYPEPEQGAFGISIDSAPSPWGSGDTRSTQIVRVGIQGKHIDTSQRKDAVLTFVIDVSGSMADNNRLPLVKESLHLLVEALRPTDQVAIVVYSDDTRVVLEPTSAEQSESILEAIDSLQTEGSTNVEDGLRLAYELAGQHYQNGATNRVILCSDGVANVGATGPDAIRETIRDYTAQGVYLTTVGFGMGDYNDYLMEQLADDGNGNYAYVDSPDEAERVFVENLTGMLQVIGQDAKIQVTFNPDVVQSYRLLGYENRDVADEDFRNDEVDAGEVGAGHSVTALYEIIPTEQGDGTALTVAIRYEDKDSGEVEELSQPFASSEFGQSFDDATADYQLAVTVAAFAEQLRESNYVQGRTLEDVLRVAQNVGTRFDTNPDVQEFVELVARANEL